ncbi:hypothetical protein [Streptomyces adustus]
MRRSCRARGARGTRGLVVCGVALAAVGGTTPLAGAAGAPEADLSYHGTAVLRRGLLDVRLTPYDHGPAAVPDATVRLKWSAPLADRQRLPGGCARTGVREVVCRTGALAADGVGERIALVLRLRGRPQEVTLALDTVWGGGTVDRNRANDRQRVLVLDTGDPYSF